MPLDPQVRQALDLLEQLGFAGFAASGLPPDQVRALMSALPREAGEELPRVEDRTVPGPAGEVPVRIYDPTARGDAPVVVHFHGGGWVVGDLDTHDHTCRALARACGAVVVSVDYRLAPEHRYPAAVEDCWAATRWVASHPAEVGGDTTRLAVAGDSAGGNLAAVVSLMARDSGGPELAFQLLVYPAVDARMGWPSIDENAEGYLLTKQDMIWFYGHYGCPDPTDWKVSPLLAENHAGLAPALVITAEFDPLRDEGEAYAEKLRAAGVNATATRYDGMIHGFFGMSATIDRAGDAMKEAAEALSRALND
ncbi:MAG TPA: alpha/beta hydrolase [Acidimicrobiales bacterium]|nr:alpha/beta hydrolase [Acidimicrobiales bacterium]